MFLHDTFSRLFEMQVSFRVTKSTHMLKSQRGEFYQIATGTARSVKTTPQDKNCTVFHQ